MQVVADFSFEGHLLADDRQLWLVSTRFPVRITGTSEPTGATGRGKPRATSFASMADMTMSDPKGRAGANLLRQNTALHAVATSTAAAGRGPCPVGPPIFRVPKAGTRFRHAPPATVAPVHPLCDSGASLTIPPDLRVLDPSIR